MKKHFNQNLIMTEKEEENFLSSNICWICEKTTEVEKVRYHCHITGKYRGAALCNCNVNLKLTKNAFITLHNLKGYDIHLINEIGKFNVKVDVIPRGLEKYIAFTINKNLVFIDSKHYMSSSLEKVVKNLSEDDFKHLTQEFGSENLKLLKRKDAYSYEYMDSFEKIFRKKNCLVKSFYKSLEDGATNGKGEKLDGYITIEEYLTCIKIWNRFNMKNIADYLDHYLKKDVLFLKNSLVSH